MATNLQSLLWSDDDDLEKQNTKDNDKNRTLNNFDNEDLNIIKEMLTSAREALVIIEEKWNPSNLPEKQTKYTSFYNSTLCEVNEELLEMNQKVGGCKKEEAQDVNLLSHNLFNSKLFGESSQNSLEMLLSNASASLLAETTETVQHNNNDNNDDVNDDSDDEESELLDMLSSLPNCTVNENFKLPDLPDEIVANPEMLEHLEQLLTTYNTIREDFMPYWQWHCSQEDESLDPMVQSLTVYITKVSYHLFFAAKNLKKVYDKLSDNNL